ncbi:MAG TPA: SelB C-terminal domain-containing protein, partial [Candidatus Krumholzibacteria bacterium]|nr:SelB C-terminal domain-containing protein [Candidatus Krumholzibacteria bacterium]
PETEADPALCAGLVARGDIVAIAGRLHHRRVLDELAARAVDIVQTHTRTHPLQWGIDKEELRRRLAFPHSAPAFNRLIDVLAASHPIFVRESRVRAGSPDMALSPAMENALTALRNRMKAAGVTFLSRDELAAAWKEREPFADAVTVLRGRGEAVDVGDGLMDPAALAHSVDVLRRVLSERSELAVGDFKDALSITRKHAIPLLEYFDARGYTVRRGNVRSAGPALAGGNKPV